MFTLFCDGRREKKSQLPHRSSSTPLLSPASLPQETQVKRAVSDDIIASGKADEHFIDGKFKELLNYLASFGYRMSHLDSLLQVTSSAEQLSELAVTITLIPPDKKAAFKNKIANFLELDAPSIGRKYAFLINHSDSLGHLKPLGVFEKKDVQVFSFSKKIVKIVTEFTVPITQLVHDLAKRGFRLEKFSSESTLRGLLAQYAIISGFIEQNQTSKFLRILNAVLRKFESNDIYRRMGYNITDLQVINSRQLNFAIDNYDGSGRIQFLQTSAPINIPSSMNFPNSGSDTDSSNSSGDSVSPDTFRQLGLK